MPLILESGLLTIKAQDFNGTKSKLARARYILAFMQTSDKAYSCRMSGLSGNAHQRIIESLYKNGSLEDSQRSGRPLTYSDTVLEKAYMRVATDDTSKLTGKGLAVELKEQGILHPSADVRRFICHLKLYIKKKGYKLISNYRRTTFHLSMSDKVIRLAHARHMLQILDKGLLSNLIFSDEVTLEESPHPKGKPIVMYSMHEISFKLPPMKIFLLALT